MARPIWSGALTFGLVSIPVKLFSAEERKEFKFSMLDKRDYSPVGYRRYSKSSGKEVAWSDVVKGYEHEKGEYVVLSDEDFKRANVKASRTIEIQNFVAREEIAPEFFETPYYLAPGAHGEKVYALLRETLRSSERMAIAQFVIRSTPHLAAVGTAGRALMLYTLRYPDELKSVTGLDLPASNLKEARVSAKEVDLAKRLIDDMTEKWDAKQFTNTYHEDLMARIKEKIKQGKTHELTKPSADDSEPSRSAKVIDLAELLKKSVGAGAAKDASARRPKSRGKPHLRLVASSQAPGKAAPKRKRARARPRRAA